MQLKIFTIPILGGENKIEELNKFLRGHQVIDVEKDIVSQNGTSYWTFCVKYLFGKQKDTEEKKIKVKIDYREVLDEKTFKIFAILRDIRKDMSKEKGVAV